MGYEVTYLQATDVSLDEDRVFRLDRIAAAWQGDALMMDKANQQACN
jgi:predicted DNA-binding transcriptional regulator YafY